MARSRSCRARSAELGQLLDALPDAVMGLDEHGVIEAANARAAVLTGRSVDDLVGRSFLGLVADDDRGTVTQRWKLGSDADRSDGGTDDGTGTSRYLSVFEMVDVAGRPHLTEATLHRSAITEGALVVILHDVTDRQQSSVALEQARRRFQQAFHSSPTGMALVRLDDSKIVDANQSLADMLQRPLESLVGHRYPRDHASRRSAGRGLRSAPASNSASPTRTSSTSATCAAMASSSGRARGCR